MTRFRPEDHGRLRPLVAAGLAVVWLGACSSGDEAVSPEAWAAAVCGAVASWQEDLGASTSDLQQRAATAADPAALRDALVSSLAASTARTDRLVEEVADAGTPGGEGGEAVAREVGDRAEEARRLLDTARAEAEALPADDAGALGEGAGNIDRALREGSEALAAPLGGPAGGPARDALRDQAGCGGLAG